MPVSITWDPSRPFAGGGGRGLFKSVGVLGESGDHFPTAGPPHVIP